MALLLEAAAEDGRVRHEPAPSVVFNEFGDNSLNMALRVFITSPSDWMPLTTDLHRAINRKFNEAGIVIAFPQRDVHLDAGEPFRISLEDVRQATSEAGDASGDNAEAPDRGENPVRP